jgi:hypothetical protein
VFEHVKLSPDHVKHAFEHVKLSRDQVVIYASRFLLAVFVGTFGFELVTKLTCTPQSAAIKLCAVAGITEPSAVAPGQSHPAFVFGEVDPGITALGSVSSEQLAFDCGNLRVNHAKAVQLTTASEGEVLYMIGEYFRLR